MGNKLNQDHRIMPKIHELKCINPYFMDVLERKKRFEIRKNDRGFKVGDYLLLREYNNVRYIYSGRQIKARIDYMTAYEQKPGYVVMSITVTDVIRTKDWIVDVEAVRKALDEKIAPYVPIQYDDYLDWIHHALDKLKALQLLENNLHEGKG
jgi:hypothetical protein